MTCRIAAILTLFVGLLAGCSTAPPSRPEPVTVSGTVTLPNGQPAKDVTINFLPTSTMQAQGGSKIGADGKFSAKLNPGKYTFAFEGGAGMRAIPEKYHSNRTEHSVEIPEGGATDLVIKLTN